MNTRLLDDCKSILSNESIKMLAIIYEIVFLKQLF